MARIDALCQCKHMDSTWRPSHRSQRRNLKWLVQFEQLIPITTLTLFSFFFLCNDKPMIQRLFFFGRRKYFLSLKNIGSSLSDQFFWETVASHFWFFGFGFGLACLLSVENQREKNIIRSILSKDINLPFAESKQRSPAPVVGLTMKR